MDSTVDNQQKDENYRVQMGRLKAALRGHFYLEAIFIEYAIMEDRLEAILRHADKWHPKQDEFISIDKKAKSVAKLAEEKKNPAHRYFPPEQTDGILAWKGKRNISRNFHCSLMQRKRITLTSNASVVRILALKSGLLISISLSVRFQQSKPLLYVPMTAMHCASWRKESY